MSFHPLMMKVIAGLLDELPEKPTIIELGNQTFDPTISGSLTKPEDQMLPLVIDYLDRRGKPYDRAKLVQFMGMSVEELKPQTAAYCHALGFSRYDAIDVNSKYGSLVMDLNQDLQTAYGFRQTYDVVTNNGTGEHIFNQYMVFRNIHNLAKIGGVMVFVLPFYNWLNHGFFNFNPILFADLAAANRYEIVRLSVGCPVGQEARAAIKGRNGGAMRLSWQAPTPELTLEDLQCRGAISPRTPRNVLGKAARMLMGKDAGGQGSLLPGVVEKLAERVANINVVACLRKTQDTPFAIPLQGMYSGNNVEDAGLRARYVA